MSRDEALTVILQSSEDYPKWAQTARSLLREHGCEDGIKPAKEFTWDTVLKDLTDLGFEAGKISNDMICEQLLDGDSRQKERRNRAAELIQTIVGSTNQRFVQDMTAEEMWNSLKATFQDTTPMSQMEVIIKAGFIRMSDFTEAALYCNEFYAALQKINGMIPSEGDSVITSRTAEAMLQAYMLTNVTDAYRPLVAEIRSKWDSNNTDLFGTIIRIERYEKCINSGPSQALPTTREMALPGTCKINQCLKRNRSSH